MSTDRAAELTIALKRIAQAVAQHLDTEHRSAARDAELRRNLGEAATDAALAPYPSAEVTTADRISELAGKAADARLALADAIRDACPKPHSYVQHRDHQPAWCNTCKRGENGVQYGATRRAAENAEGTA